MVQRNAPNWPAMVQKEKETSKKSKSYAEFKANISKNAAESIFSESKSQSQIGQLSRLYNRKAKISSNDNEPIFASKSRLLRQCDKCQILFTNFHSCSVET